MEKASVLYFPGQSHSSEAVGKSPQGNPACAAFSSHDLSQCAGQVDKSSPSSRKPFSFLPVPYSFQSAFGHHQQMQILQCLTGCSVPAPSLEAWCLTNTSLLWSLHTLCCIFWGFWAGFRFARFLRCCIVGAKEPRAPPGHPAAALRGAWCGCSCWGACSVRLTKNQPTHPAFPFLELKMYQEYFVALVYMCKYSSLSKV